MCCNVTCVCGLVIFMIHRVMRLLRLLCYKLHYSTGCVYVFVYDRACAYHTFSDISKTARTLTFGSLWCNVLLICSALLGTVSVVHQSDSTVSKMRLLYKMCIRDSKYAARASTVDILLKTNLAVRPLPGLEIEQEHHEQQNSSPDIRIQFMTCS